MQMGKWENVGGFVGWKGKKGGFSGFFFSFSLFWSQNEVKWVCGILLGRRKGGRSWSYYYLTTTIQKGFFKQPEIFFFFFFSFEIFFLLFFFLFASLLFFPSSGAYIVFSFSLPPPHPQQTTRTQGYGRPIRQVVVYHEKGEGEAKKPRSSQGRSVRCRHKPT